jgi:argininosuccinate lyase
MFLTIGITTVDLFLAGLEKMPAFGGDEFTVDNLAFCEQPLTTVLGGNGAICAYVLARLGAQVELASAVGADAWGDLALRWLHEANAGLEALVRTPQAATATTTVITDRRLNRVSFHHPGASLIYTPEDLSPALIENADVCIFSSFSLLPKWRPEGCAQLLAQAYRSNAMTALDIGPAIGQPAALSELSASLPHVDFFLCNAHELAVCTGIDDTPAAAAQVLQAGARCAVIKRGRQGAQIFSHGQPPIEVPAFRVDARFTVGAGDSFNAGFLYGIHQGWEMARAARFANAVAAVVVSGARGALGAPSLAEVEQRLDRHPTAPG